MDDLLFLEEAAVRRGREAGLRDGIKAAEAEGREVGSAKGLEVGAEIGYYVGACKVLLGHADTSERARRAVENFHELVASMLRDPLDDLDLENLRLKFRAATSHCRFSRRLEFRRISEDAESLQF